MNNKKLKSSCNICKYNSSDSCLGHGRICYDHDTFGMNIESTKAIFPKGCNDFDLSEMTYEQMIKERLMEIADLMGMNWDEINCELYLTRKDIDIDDEWEFDPLHPQNA